MAVITAGGNVRGLRAVSECGQRGWCGQGVVRTSTGHWHNSLTTGRRHGVCWKSVRFSYVDQGTRKGSLVTSKKKICTPRKGFKRSKYGTVLINASLRDILNN